MVHYQLLHTLKGQSLRITVVFLCFLSHSSSTENHQKSLKLSLSAACRDLYTNILIILVGFCKSPTIRRSWMQGFGTKRRTLPLRQGGQRPLCHREPCHAAAKSHIYCSNWKRNSNLQAILQYITMIYLHMSLVYRVCVSPSTGPFVRVPGHFGGAIEVLEI